MATALTGYYYFSNINSLEKKENNSRSRASEKGNKTRELIISIVEQCPGIRYRQLLRQTRLSYGSLSHHTKILVAQGKVKASKTNRVTHFYPSRLDDFSCSIASEIAGKTSRQIIAVLADQGSHTLGEIATKIHKTRSTVCWYLQRMHRKGLVLKTRNHLPHYKTVRYSLLPGTILQSIPEMLLPEKYGYLDEPGSCSVSCERQQIADNRLR